MKKRLFIFVCLVACMAFQEQSIDTSGPEKIPNIFDVRTGADAVTSGTDITDKDLQIKEPFNKSNQNKNLKKKKEDRHVSHPPHSP
jgi:hypothetical protein